MTALTMYPSWKVSIGGVPAPGDWSRFWPEVVVSDGDEEYDMEEQFQ